MSFKYLQFYVKMTVSANIDDGSWGSDVGM